jgi:hypothetical protein
MLSDNGGGCWIWYIELLWPEMPAEILEEPEALALLIWASETLSRLNYVRNQEDGDR